MLVVAFIGAVLASFCCVVAERLPKGQSFIKGRSICMNCHRPLRFWQTIPIVSYAYLKGKCRYCTRKIPVDLWIYEIIGATSFALLFVIYDKSVFFLEGALLVLVGITVSRTDLLYGIIPNKVTVTFFIGCVVLEILFQKLTIFQIITCMCIYLFLLLFVRCIKDGMGGGDIKYFTAVAIFFTLQEMYIVILTACVIGLLQFLLSRFKMRELRFAPAIAVATVVVFIGRDFV